ncbi:MAG: UDP-glucuronic acid decarboxylase family protein [Phycisphaerae bacterium]
MRAIVTGCAGFIGFHLTGRLLDEGVEVVGVDNVVSGQDRNVADLSARRGFTFLRQDVSAGLQIDGPVDATYNLACPASPIDFDPKRLEILAVCSRGVWNLLDLTREKNATMLHTSTSEVYGDPLEHPQREAYWGNVNPIGPRSCYDEGKRFAEALITAYRHQHGVRVRVARIFNTYGPRMRTNDGRVLPNFISQALRGEPLTVYGDGKQTRSLCYIDDQVDGLIRLSRSDVDGPVNIGNPVELTMLELAQEIIRLTGSKSRIRHVELPKDDPKVRRPDITRAQTLLGWSPRVPREEGLKRTIEWFKTALNA